MIRLFSIVMLYLCLGPTVLGSNTQRQYNILTNIEGQTLQLKKAMQGGNPELSQNLDEINKLVLSSAEIDPSKGKWKGNFVKALKDRKTLEQKWVTFKNQFNSLNRVESFQAFSKNLDEFLNLRKEGDYGLSNHIVSSGRFQADFESLKMTIGSRVDSEIPSGKLDAYLANINELLEDLRAHKKVANKNGDPLMALSSRPPPEEPSQVESGNQSITSGWVLFRIGVFVCFGFCILIFGMKSLGRNHSSESTETVSEQTQEEVISSETSAIPKSYSVKAECIHRLSDHYFQERLFSCLSQLDQQSSEFESAKNIIVTRLNMIIADLSRCSDTDLESLRDHLKSNFRTIQSYVKALKSGNNPSRANECIINSFRIILEEMKDLGDSLRAA